MKGYIYTMFRGADPDRGWELNDPILKPKPTLGACMPNIRRAVTPGDYVFVVSGRVPGFRQYVVGGFKVQEKLTAMAAYKRFPQYRLSKRPDGTLSGNIIVDGRGRQHRLDYHSNFDGRRDNYIVGTQPIMISGSHAVDHCRQDTVPFLEALFDKPGTTVADVIGRWRRLDQPQVTAMLSWLQSVRKSK